jgi:hypothetical protein
VTGVGAGLLARILKPHRSPGGGGGGARRPSEDRHLLKTSARGGAADYVLCVI